VASLAVITMGPAGACAETVIVQGDDGAAGTDGINARPTECRELRREMNKALRLRHLGEGIVALS
jgi:hypothetical protein